MQVHCGSRGPCDGDAGVDSVRRLATDAAARCSLAPRPDSKRSEYDDDAFRENLNAGD